MKVLPGFDRRHFLHSLGAGFGSTALLGLEGLTRRSVSAGEQEIDPLRPYAPRKPDFAAKATSVIFLFMVGGPSHIDSFDHKPLLSQLDGKEVPESIASAVKATKHANVFHGCEPTIMTSPFRFRQYGACGTWVSELFPEMAKHIDDLCLIHSLQADSNNHAPASYQLHTGDIRGGKASLGSWITYGLGTENEDLPGYVVLFDAGPLGGIPNYSSGFLPPAYQPTRLRDRGIPVLDLSPPEAYAAKQRRSLDLIQQLNMLHREDHPGATNLEARIASYELAYRMQAAALDTGNFEDETAATLDLYAARDQEERTASFGRKCLMARRLVERGVRFVQLYDMPDKDGWDAHAKIIDNHVPRARWTDRAIGGLLSDLKHRGLWDSTLVIWASEFGRTPMMQGDHGRQHNAAGFTIWLAGGGVPGGLRIGATDEIGLMAVDRPLQMRDLHATILALLGLEHEALSFAVSGRAERLTGVAGSAKPIREILEVPAKPS